MKQLEKFIGLAALLLISGCAATITRDAQRVVLHTQLSAVLSDCKKLGIVSGEADAPLMDVPIMRQQAINNMRDNAFKQYQADTVVLVNVDEFQKATITVKQVAQGMAFKCNGDNHQGGASPATETANRVVFKNINSKITAICDRLEYATYFLKSPCLPTSITLIHLADTTKITQEQKDILLKYRSEIETVGNERNELLRNTGNAVDKRYADYLESVQPEIDKYNLDLFRGIITWGEYNQIRKNTAAKMLATTKDILQPAQNK